MKKIVRSISFMVILLAIPIMLSIFSLSHAAAPPPTPFFRIELGSHAANIKAVDTDARNRFIVTASHDKTVRIWSLADNKLLKILRPPIGSDREGILDAVAVLPDGSVIACGGKTGREWNGTESIYIFDRESGRLVRSLEGLPGAVTSLSFSKDGLYLAATMAKGGIIVYETDKWTVLGYDDTYDEEVPSADFDREGRLVAVGPDGIRVYGPFKKGAMSRLVPMKSSGLPVAGRPFSVRFSPDSRSIAIGYSDPYRVDIINANDLTARFTPYNESENSLDKVFAVGAIAWSIDGTNLYAAGALGRKGNKIILNWTINEAGELSSLHFAGKKKGGKKKRKNDNLNVNEISTPCISQINQLLPLSGGRLVFVSNDSISGILDANNHLIHAITPTLPVFKRISNIFRISPGGDRIQFAYENYGASSAIFSVSERTLSTSNESSQEQMSAPLISSPVPLTGWNYTNEPKLNGVPLDILEKRSRCLAVAPDNESFLIGAESMIFRFDFTGKTIWRIKMPVGVLGLNISKDNRLFTVALSDGTIRWFTMNKPSELLALFAHPDRKRWVMWTPEGYFDASPDGAELAGYHINQGKEKEARFVSIASLYDVFYRPDIIQAKLKGEDISSLITLTAEEALKIPPPEVAFEHVPDKVIGKTARICYQIKSTGGGIGEVRLFQNGKLIKSDGFYREVVKKESGEKLQIAGLNSREIYQEQRGLVLREKNITNAAVSMAKGEQFDECVDIEPMSGENEISIAAFNATNTVQSVIKTASFISARKTEEPHLYILSVGIDRYLDPSVNLKYAAKDSTDFLERLPHKALSIYKPGNIHTISLTDAKAGKIEIKKAVAEMADKIRHGDGFIFFNASHGVLLQNQYYIVTADFNGDLENSDVLISSNEIVEMSKKIKALSQLFIFDTCHAGGVDNIVSGLYDARMVNLARKMGLHIYASAASVQAAMDGYKGNGLYTHILLHGIENGKEVDGSKSGMVTVKDLGVYTREKASEVSTKLGQPQTPLIINFGRDYPLFSVK